MGRIGHVVGIYVILAALGVLGWLFTTNIERLPMPSVVADTCSNLTSATDSNSSIAHRYIVTFGLANGQQEAFVEWQRPSQIISSLRDFEAKHLHAVSFVPQIMIAQNVELRQRPAFHARLQCYAVAREHVHSVFAPQQWLPEAGTGRDPALRLTVFIPPPELTPLCIADRNEPRLLFIEPQWGAVLILNPQQQQQQQQQSQQQQQQQQQQNSSALISTEQEQAAVKLLIQQLARLLRLQPESVSDIARSHVRRAVRDVCSLNTLIEQLPEVPVSARVTESAAEVLRLVQTAEQALSAGDIATAAAASRDAALLAERTFFESSMIAQLYFSPEQTQAIYLPFWLPAAASLLVGSLSVLQKWRQRRRATATAAASTATAATATAATATATATATTATAAPTTATSATSTSEAPIASGQAAADTGFATAGAGVTATEPATGTAQ